MNRDLQIEIAPEYFPPLESMARIGQADVCVVRADYQYSRQSFQNRTRIRNADGWQWLTVPVLSGQFGSDIGEMKVDDPRTWRSRHLKGLRYNYSTAPFYEHFIADVEQLLFDELTNLADLTYRTVMWSASAIGFDTKIELYQTQSASLDGCTEIDSKIASYRHPTYRQNFAGFVPMMSVLDVLFNHGPDSKRIIMEGIIMERNES